MGRQQSQGSAPYLAKSLDYLDDSNWYSTVNIFG